MRFLANPRVPCAKVRRSPSSMRPFLPRLCPQRHGFNMTAVIEEEGGAKSFWALAHASGKPDFHDAACFVGELAAADRA